MNQPQFEGFTPTSSNYRWKGKYRCIYCKTSGYITDSWIAEPRWWGHRHGDNCRKKDKS